MEAKVLGLGTAFGVCFILGIVGVAVYIHYRLRNNSEQNLASVVSDDRSSAENSSISRDTGVNTMNYEEEPNPSTKVFAKPDDSGIRLNDKIDSYPSMKPKVEPNNENKSYRCQNAQPRNDPSTIGNKHESPNLESKDPKLTPDTGISIIDLLLNLKSLDRV